MIALDREQYKTEDMYTGNKKDLFRMKHPIVRMLEEIPEILGGERENELPSNAISLKVLFSRAKMDEFHVESKQLVVLAGKMLNVCQELAEKNITPGFYDLEDIYTDFENVYILRPERFQLLSYEQDYEWYPEDEKIFGEIELLDEKEQAIADCRLIYKILIASTRGNVKVPPRMNESDYSEIFYKKLSPQLRTFFEDPTTQTRERLSQLLQQMMEQNDEAYVSGSRVEAREFKEESEEGGVPLACTYLILRTNLNQSSKIGKLLYDLQDAIEMESSMGHYRLFQSFILGDGNVNVRKMNKDPMGFRIQLKNKIKSYSAGEALIIAADYLEKLLKYWKKEPDASCRCVILYDGELQNSPLFQYSIQRMEKLKKQGMQFYLVSDKEYQGEACQKLKILLNRKEDQYVVQSYQEI